MSNVYCCNFRKVILQVSEKLNNTLFYSEKADSVICKIFLLFYWVYYV